MKITCTKIDPRMYSKDGYWFLSRHGFGPGTIPSDCEVLDVCEPDGTYDTYIKLDRFLTTKELNYYDLKEQVPPDELTSCSEVEAAEDIEVLDDVEDIAAIEDVIAANEDCPVVRFLHKYDDGSYVDSYDNQTIVEGTCWTVGCKDAECSTEWRAFSPESWKLVKGMTMMR